MDDTKATVLSILADLTGKMFPVTWTLTCLMKES